MRWSAAYALGEIGDKAAVTGLLKLFEDSNSNVRETGAYALGKIGDKAEIPGLLKLLEDSDWFVCNSAAYDLREIAKQYKEKIAHHLPHLLTLIPSKSGKEVHSFILAIQDACQYYNYPIRQLSLTPEINKTTNSAGQTFNIEKGGIINTGTVNIKGDQIGTQHNIHPKN